MSWKDSELATTRVAAPSRDRFLQRGEESIKDTALAAVQYLRTLPAGEAENFAVAIRDTATELAHKEQARLDRYCDHPLELPDRLLKPNARDFPTSRKRKMTGYEAALQAGIDVRLRRRRDAVEAEAKLIERQHVLAEIRAETQLRASQEHPNFSAARTIPPILSKTIPRRAMTAKTIPHRATTVTARQGNQDDWDELESKLPR